MKTRLEAFTWYGVLLLCTLVWGLLIMGVIAVCRWVHGPPTVTITSPAPVRFEATQEGRVDVAEYVVQKGKVGSVTVIDWRNDGAVAYRIDAGRFRFERRRR